MSTNRTSSVWDAVAAVIKNGRAPVIRVRPEDERKPIKRKTKPVIRDRNNQFAHYATPTVGAAHKRPRCLCCHKRLRNKDIEVCSDTCRETFLSWARAKVARLTGGALDVEITATAAKHLRRVA